MEDSQEREIELMRKHLNKAICHIQIAQQELLLFEVIFRKDTYIFRTYRGIKFSSRLIKRLDKLKSKITNVLIYYRII